MKIKAGIEWGKNAESRTPEQWKAEIEKIEDKHTKIQVACIAWWDFFAHRKVSEEWTHLNELRDSWKPDQNADENKVYQTLLDLGYPRKIAKKRSIGRSLV